MIREILTEAKSTSSAKELAKKALTGILNDEVDVYEVIAEYIDDNESLIKKFAKETKKDYNNDRDDAYTELADETAAILLNLSKSL